MELLRMRAALRGIKTRRQVILHIAGKQNAAFGKIITVAQQNFACRGKTRHETLLRKLEGRL
ncbi:hypothetical protein BN131_1481 [Cronobacter malonaticus 681]|nr:hypothetical protein BN131_1481 [Cronobacter malonaticus 681]